MKQQNGIDEFANKNKKDIKRRGGKELQHLKNNNNNKETKI